MDQTDRDFYARLTEGQAQREGAAEKLVHLIEETSLGPGGLSDWTLWMEMWVRARRDPAVRDTYFRLDRRQRQLIADIVREGQASGEFDRDADPDDFALALSGLMDGLGVQVTLGQPDVTRGADGRPLPGVGLGRARVRASSRAIARVRRGARTMSGTTRRTFIQRAGLAAASLAVPGVLEACGSTTPQVSATSASSAARGPGPSGRAGCCSRVPTGR